MKPAWAPAIIQVLTLLIIHEVTFNIAYRSVSKRIVSRTGFSVRTELIPIDRINGSNTATMVASNESTAPIVTIRLNFPR